MPGLVLFGKALLGGRSRTTITYTKLPRQHVFVPATDVPMPLATLGLPHVSQQTLAKASWQFARKSYNNPFTGVKQFT